MLLGLPAGVDSPLGKRLATLTFLRLVVLTLFLGLVELWYLREMAFGGFSTVVAVWTVGIAFLLSAAYAAMLRRGQHLKEIAYAQLLTDQLTWTALVYISGGVTSGSTSLYGLTCVSGAILVGTSGAVWAAACGMLSYLGLCTAFALKWFVVPGDQVVAAYVTETREMIYPAFSTLAATALVAMLAAYLAERLRAFGGKLEAATKRAEEAERLAALGRLAAALAHEIRNPLGSIRGSIELMRTGAELNDEDKKLCQIIEREAARLNDLVTDMVDLSRPRAPTHSEVDLAAIARGVVELAQRSSRGGDVGIAYDGPDELIVVADAAQMRQVLWNLVRNAMQASEKGAEVVVRLKPEDDGSVLMSVSDEGQGIPESKRAHIFDAFFTTRSHGVGIGLAVVKKVSDAHGFVIDIDSAVGRGTVFSLRIPKASVLSSLAALCFGVLMIGSIIGCGGSDWVRGDREQMWWGDDLPGQPAANATNPTATPSAATPAARPTGTAMSVTGPPAEKFRNTYYDFPAESATLGGPRKSLFNAECKLIREVPDTFHDAICVQGSGRLATGETASFARRDCECASVCPRTDQKICFDVLDKNKFPFGRGAAGKAITPLRSVAVDVDVIALGTVLYIPDYHGLRGPDGKAHDGCFIAERPRFEGQRQACGRVYGQSDNHDVVEPSGSVEPRRHRDRRCESLRLPREVIALTLASSRVEDARSLLL